MQERLSIHLDGEPVHLYRFTAGSYEDKRIFLCVHTARLSDEEVRARVAAVLDQIPEELDCYGYDSPDLFEQAIAKAGFTFVDGAVIGGLWLNQSSFFIERVWLARKLREERR